MTKICSHCKTAKSLSDFYKCKYKKYRSWCKKCEIERQKNPKYKASSKICGKRWREKNKLSKKPNSGIFKCSKCKIMKDIGEFHINITRTNGRHNQCKNCIQTSNKKRYLRQNWGLTTEQFQELKEKQNNKCAICLQDCKNFKIDHDHQTGKVRGLLCNDCNLSLGRFKDNKENLQRAISYLDNSTDISFVGKIRGLH